MGRGLTISRTAAAGVFALAAAHCAGSFPVPFDTNAPDGGIANGANGSPASSGDLYDAATFEPPLDAGDPFAACATATANVQRSPIYMLLVLDGSGSMNDDEKWAAVVPALEAFIDDIAQRNDATFGVGLTIFSDTMDPTQGQGKYLTMDVPIATVGGAQAAALHTRLDEAQPLGDTPTLQVLVGQYTAMESFTPSAPLPASGKKVVVLITDGVPYPNTDEQKQPAIDLAGREFAEGGPTGPITTFAVGVGYTFPYEPDMYDQVFMGSLAVAGGDPNEPCDPTELNDTWNMCHFQITPSGQPNPGELEMQFASAIDKIRSRVTSCTLTIDPPDGGTIDPAEVNVRFTDSATGEVSTFPEDPTNGWTYDDPAAPTAVILHGDACATLTDDPDGKVQVVLGCATVLK